MSLIKSWHWTVWLHLIKQVLQKHGESRRSFHRWISQTSYWGGVFISSTWQAACKPLELGRLLGPHTCVFWGQGSADRKPTCCKQSPPKQRITLLRYEWLVSLIKQLDGRPRWEWSVMSLETKHMLSHTSLNGCAWCELVYFHFE